jgi:hypothetical protein
MIFLTPKEVVAVAEEVTYPPIKNGDGVVDPGSSPDVCSLTG